MFTPVLLFVIGVTLSLVLLLWLYGERWRLLRPSTWKAMKEFGLKQILNLKALHMYIYGRWTNQYIKTLIYRVMPRLKTKGRQWLSDHYHAKVLTEEQARAIITVKKTIPLRDLEQIIPYPMARDLVLQGPPEVIAYECPCRHSRPHSCQPTQVCMVIGQPFVDFILEHNPQSSRRLTQSEALELLEAEHNRGHVHTAWFKDACLDRFYNICNCCKCCCGGIEAMVKHGIPMLAPSGYISEVNKNLCTACGDCVAACPFSAISLGKDGIHLDEQKCMGCGVCIEACQTKARSLVRDGRKGRPLDVRFLAKKAA
ncbi:MAG TPA: 4Fe-4S binding protein [Nitrospirota bacterium]|nr:4Fe-4S binding protein [Nitrospirota bacterium]